ncbi:MAG: hypothetical protein ACW986_17575 [Promethearchaeota archaeon]|jgi:hypothetical protein
MKEERLDKEIIEEVWDIRNYIQNLEDIKNEIINHLESLKELDESTKSIWISDVKGFYYNAVSAWEMLRTTTERVEKKSLETSKHFLYSARSLLAKIISELQIFSSKKSSKLIGATEEAFKECWDAFWSIYNEIRPHDTLTTPSERIVKISDLEYHLPCSVCGKVAVEFSTGYGRFNENESLLFKGITHGCSLKIELAEILFKILDKKSLLGAHEFMKKRFYEGLDAYCPECDKIYCWEHYNAKVEYDDGFYDCTYGECPKGHRRMIDD